MRKKALIALVFACGVVNSNLPMLADQTVDDIDLFGRQLEALPDVLPSLKAIRLLQYAQGSLNGSIDESWRSFGEKNDQEKKDSLRYIRNLPNNIRNWAETLSSAQSFEALQSQTKGTSNNSENDILKKKVVASKFISLALTLIPSVSEKTIQLELYYIAALLSKKADDKANAERCWNILNDAIADCENAKTVNNVDAEAVVSILDCEAYGIAPVTIPVYENNFKLARTDLVNDKEFNQAEKLKLKAVLISDRLPASNDLRRMAHRNLAIWYLMFGKEELAEAQKKSLFDLIGIKDERLLYPLNGSCGHPVWWRTDLTGVMGVECGMG